MSAAASTQRLPYSAAKESPFIRHGTNTSPPPSQPPTYAEFDLNGTVQMWMLPEERCVVMGFRNRPQLQVGMQIEVRTPPCSAAPVAPSSACPHCFSVLLMSVVPCLLLPGSSQIAQQKVEMDAYRMLASPIESIIYASLAKLVEGRRRVLIPLEISPPVPGVAVGAEVGVTLVGCSGLPGASELGRYQVTVSNYDLKISRKSTVTWPWNLSLTVPFPPLPSPSPFPSLPIHSPPLFPPLPSPPLPSPPLPFPSQSQNPDDNTASPCSPCLNSQIKRSATGSPEWKSQSFKLPVHDKFARFDAEVTDVHTGQSLGSAIFNVASLSDGCAAFWATGEQDRLGLMMPGVPRQRRNRDLSSADLRGPLPFFCAAVFPQAPTAALSQSVGSPRRRRGGSASLLSFPTRELWCRGQR